jgi:hypothetical protein
VHVQRSIITPCSYFVLDFLLLSSNSIQTQHLKHARLSVNYLRTISFSTFAILSERNGSLSASLTQYSLFVRVFDPWHEKSFDFSFLTGFNPLILHRPKFLMVLVESSE